MTDAQKASIAARDPRYARLWGLATQPKDRAISGCVHRGEPTGETVTCPSCRGRVELKLYGCSVHGRCTLGKKAEGVACCATCPDFAAP